MVGPEDLKALMGQRIQKAREGKGLSQTELAGLLAKDPSTISNYESGFRTIKSTDLPLLAASLDVSIGYFFGDEITSREATYAVFEWMKQHRADVLHRLQDPNRGAKEVQQPTSIDRLVEILFNALTEERIMLEREELISRLSQLNASTIAFESGSEPDSDESEAVRTLAALLLYIDTRIEKRVIEMLTSKIKDNLLS